MFFSLSLEEFGYLTSDKPFPRGEIVAHTERMTPVQKRRRKFREKFSKKTFLERDSFYTFNNIFIFLNFFKKISDFFPSGILRRRGSDCGKFRSHW